MHAAQYILERMRTCKALYDDVDESSGGASVESDRRADDRKHKKHGKKSRRATASCFSSVGSAAHTFHGDDAVGFGPGYMVVADGVSGTMKASGVLARLLVSETLASLAKLRKRAREECVRASDFRQSMEAATKSARKLTKRKGRLDSTLTAVFFDDTARQMFVFTIGDCKCVLLRGDALIFESDSIIYDFNVPAVVSSNKAITYAGDVQVQTCPYEAGDVCLLFSDGVHDNLFVDEVVGCVTAARASSKPGIGELMAQKIMKRAKDTFTICNDYIPFAVSAAGFCRDAVDELEASDSVDKEDFARFRQKCIDIPSLAVTRPAFDKEKRVRQLAFYSASNLLSFAHKKQGKRDDISVCAAVLA